ncbi:hypothetical protein DYB32_008465 [Aphanomyces invadans]|uniref:CWF21 domain-containing protein n=1 Tax=Aphanomyces invadans TaxID=157072 RepID=A0A418ALA7_9STRA|nr:hypothetical protein DYB32_008465 [Aphanomyces invadans]
MSYNGVGLRTARGSGTNGYVMRNLSYVKPAHIRERERQAQMKYAMLEEPHNKHPVNKQILLHEKKRQVEVKVMELRDELEEQGCDDDEIEEKCAAFREKIRARMETDARRLDDSKHASSHAKAMKKEKELAALKDAFGIRDNYVEGTSFDVDLQEQRRLERLNEYDRKQREREERANRPRLQNNDRQLPLQSKLSMPIENAKSDRPRHVRQSQSSAMLGHQPRREHGPEAPYEAGEVPVRPEVGRLVLFLAVATRGLLPVVVSVEAVAGRHDGDGTVAANPRCAVAIADLRLAPCGEVGAVVEVDRRRSSVADVPEKVSLPRSSSARARSASKAKDDVKQTDGPKPEGAKDTRRSKSASSISSSSGSDMEE